MGISFWARGDSASANNSEINSMGTNKVATTQLTFESSGANGDTKFDFNGGDSDPDTVMIIDGVARTFTVEIMGTLDAKKLNDVNGEDLRGEKVVIVTDDLTGQRYYFMPDRQTSYQTMDEMPNGAIPVSNVSTQENPPLCFLRGSHIDTPAGPRPIETLQAGDLVVTDRGAQPIRWIGHSHLTPTALILDRSLWPVRIRAGALGNGLPTQDLTVSPNHRIVLSGWSLEMHLGLQNALCAAKHLTNGLSIAPWLPDEGVDYFHIMFDTHRMVRAHGIMSESLFLGAQALRHVGPEAMAELRRLFPEIMAAAETATEAGNEAGAKAGNEAASDVGGATALPVLKRHEARLAG